jgi:signal transduction histidine kinase
MNALRWRLTLWFALSLLVVVAALVVSAHWHLDYELRKEKWERTHPAHPDWILHGSFTDKEVHDILGELLQFWALVAVPVVGLALSAAYFLARRSTKPVRNVNCQLSRLGPATLSDRINAPDADPEFDELVRHLNALLERIETSFNHLRDYTSQVAHELRTPLQLMRLQVETNAARMEPGLAEDLQQELARLSNYVENALLIARAEQGRLEIHPEDLSLKVFLEDLLEPFTRLAEEEGRRLLWSCPVGLAIRTDRDLLKQVFFNLVNNALGHGTGDILLRVRVRPRSAVILVGNRCPVQKGTTGLGIGLRLVRILAEQLPETHLATRHTAYFWVRMQVPYGTPVPVPIMNAAVSAGANSAVVGFPCSEA